MSKRWLGIGLESSNVLKRSLDEVKQAHAGIKPADLQSKVTIEGREATMDGVHLRILVHANEHTGQLVAYARMNRIIPPRVANRVVAAIASPPGE